MKKKMSVVVAVIAATLPILGAQATVQAADVVDDGGPGQASLDLSASQISNPYAGMWGDAKGGAAGRPFIKSLSVINAGVATPMVTNGTVTTPASATPGAITATITPYNLCKPGQTPAAGVCYTSPNRLGMTLGYVKDANGIGTNFSDPRDRSGNPLTLAAPMNENTVIDMVINMNTWGSTLRWTWFNGVPLGWNISNIGAPDADVRLKFQLGTGPSMICSSGIPVGPCDPVQAQKNYPTRVFAPVKILKGDFIFSLDETSVSAELNGALFASVNADLGSLETIPAGSPKMALTYGVSGPNELNGTTNLGRFFAFVSDQSLLNYFGVTQDVLDSPEFASSDLMAITRTDGGAQSAPTWSRTSPDTFGSAGYLLTVNDIQFSGKAVSSQGVRSSALALANPAKFQMNNKTSSAVSVRKVGAKRQLSLSATTAACRAKTCRWVVSRAAGITSAASTKLTAVSVKTRTNRVSSSVTVKAKSGERLSVVLQVKKGGSWNFVSSRMVVVK